MQWNVRSGYQLSNYSGIKENHGKTLSSWPLAGPSGCNLISRQQLCIKYANPNISPYPWCCFIENLTSCFYKYFYVHIFWISTKPCVTPAEGIHAYMHKYGYLIIGGLEKSNVIRGLLN
jgi:hypothetical protein